MSIAGEIARILRDTNVGEAAAERLGAYGQIVLEFNRTTNVTAARDAAAFAVHILDSLTLSADVDGSLIDLGSGAGLPGIPLAIVTGQPVTLIDSVKKKATFLARLLDDLDLTGQAIDARAERLGKDPAFREKFQCATARAVSTAPTVAELTVPFLAIGGRALLQRGTMEERERQALYDAAPMLGTSVVEERSLGGELRVFVLRKEACTPPRFPRREGIPEKRPLCF